MNQSNWKIYITFQQLDRVVKIKKRNTDFDDEHFDSDQIYINKLQFQETFPWFTLWNPSREGFQFVFVNFFLFRFTMFSCLYIEHETIKLKKSHKTTLFCCDMRIAKRMWRISSFAKGQKKKMLIKIENIKIKKNSNLCSSKLVYVRYHVCSYQYINSMHKKS